MLISSCVLMAAIVALIVGVVAYNSGRRSALRDARPGDVRIAWSRTIAKRAAKQICGVVAEANGKKATVGLVEALEQLILDEMR